MPPVSADLSPDDRAALSRVLALAQRAADLDRRLLLLDLDRPAPDARYEPRSYAVALTLLALTLLTLAGFACFIGKLVLP